MEEGKATAIGRIEPAAQIIPTLDLVHGLVGDDLFQDRGRRLPVDPAHDQKTAVEPGIEQVLEVAVDLRQRRGQFLVAPGLAQQVAAHGDDLGGRPRCQIETTEEFLARAFDCRLQLRQCLIRRIAGKGGRGVLHLLAVGLHRACEIAEEGALALGIGGAVATEKLAGENHPRRLATARHQRLGELFHAVGGASAAQRPGQQLPTLLGNRIHQFLQERDVDHRQRLPSSGNSRYIATPDDWFNHASPSAAPRLGPGGPHHALKGVSGTGVSGGLCAA